MSVRARRWALLAAVVTVGVLVDQVTKHLANEHVRGRGFVSVIDGVLALRYARNPGAFFSLGADLSPDVRRVLFVVASAAACALIVRIYARSADEQRILRAGLTLLLAGALGNLVDRVAEGAVTDFLYLYWRDVFEDWATFNVADVLITAGLVLLAADMIWPRARTPGQADLAKADPAPPAPQTEASPR